MLSSILRFLTVTAIISVVVAVGLHVAGLSLKTRTESYRFKLTLAVNTPDGVKRGSGVSKLTYFDVSIPARGTMQKYDGEAIYLDLGFGASPLIALVTNKLHPKYGKESRWTRDSGPHNNLTSELYGVTVSNGLMDYAAQLARQRGKRSILPTDLPSLVTFSDINDPKSVIEVDPNDLQATLGPNVSWNEITLEITDEPVSKGIEQKLTWLPLYFQKNLNLDGSMGQSKNELSNILTWSDFDQSADLKRSDWRSDR